MNGQESIPVGALAPLSAILRDFGQDPWHLLESHGVTARVLADLKRPALPITLHGRIVQDAIAATQCDHLGLLLGQGGFLDNTGPLRFLILSTPTVREAIEALVRFGPIWHPAVRGAVSCEQGYASLSITIDGVFPGRDQILTAYLSASVQIMEMILGRPWRPAAVRISHREPRSAAPYRRFFRAPVLFDQPRHEVLFPEQLLDETRAGSDQRLESFLRKELIEMQDAGQPDLVRQVRGAIESLLPSGECSIERVAALFAVHRLTLHRHLARHDTTFEALLDDTRRRLAEQMLTYTDLPIAEVAGALGYRNHGNFTRAFRRWHDTPPRGWRGQPRADSA